MTGRRWEYEGIGERKEKQRVQEQERQHAAVDR